MAHGLYEAIEWVLKQKVKAGILNLDDIQTMAGLRLPTTSTVWTCELLPHPPNQFIFKNNIDDSSAIKFDEKGEPNYVTGTMRDHNDHQTIIENKTSQTQTLEKYDTFAFNSGIGLATAKEEVCIGPVIRNRRRMQDIFFQSHHIKGFNPAITIVESRDRNAVAFACEDGIWHFAHIGGGNNVRSTKFTFRKTPLQVKIHHVTHSGVYYQIHTTGTRGNTLWFNDKEMFSGESFTVHCENEILYVKKNFSNTWEKTIFYVAGTELYNIDGAPPFAEINDPTQRWEEKNYGNFFIRTLISSNGDALTYALVPQLASDNRVLRTRYGCTTKHGPIFLDIGDVWPNSITTEVRVGTTTTVFGRFYDVFVDTDGIRLLVDDHEKRPMLARCPWFV